MIFRVMLALGLMLGLPATSAQAQAAGPSPTQAFAERLDVLVPEVMRDLGGHGVAVALIERGRVTAIKTYGHADVASGRLVTPETVFNAASVSKAATAWGVMALVEQGRIDLDAPVFGRITRWRLPPAEWAADGVTARRLLAHTAGLSRGTVAIWTPNDVLPSLEDALSSTQDEYEPVELVQAPGQGFRYSGGGFGVLQMLIEETTGRAFADHMQDAVLAPLEMNSSRFGWPPEIVAAMATPYSEFGGIEADFRSPEMAAGGLNMTIGEFGRFAASHLAGDGPAGGGALKPETVGLMLTAAENTEGRQGLGVAIAPGPDGRVLFGHDGGNPGWGSTYRVEPATGNGIALMVNRSWGTQVLYPILCAWRAAVGPEPDPNRVCQRDLGAVLLTTVVHQGLEAGEARYRRLRADSPQAMNDAAAGWAVRRFTVAERHAEALAIAGWHAGANPASARAHEILADARQAAGDRAGALVALGEAVRLAPEDAALAEKQRRIQTES